MASVGVGVALLLAFRTQDLSVLGDTLGAQALSGGSVSASLLAAVAIGGRVFIGFDACVGISEETRDAARHVPRAIWIALLSVAALVMLNAVATTLAHPDLVAVAWLTFETINIAWPRASLAPPDAPTYQVWAAPILLATIAAVGLTYLVAARSHRRLASD